MTIRAALHLEEGLASRVTSVLLAEPEAQIGLFGQEPGRPRTHPVSTLAAWDVLAVSAVTDETRTAVDEALEHGLPLVVGADLPRDYDSGDGVVVEGARSGAGLATALALSLVGSSNPPVESRLAWTTSGERMGAGVAVTFPEPVGPLWAGRVDSRLPWPSVTCLAAPDDSLWKGVAIRLVDDGGNVRTRGVADHRDFLDAICLAAAALAAARGAYPPGVSGPGDPEGRFMELAQRAGLAVASFRPD